MKILFLSLLFTAFLSTASACSDAEISFPKNNVCAGLSWVSGPSMNQFNSVSLQLSETNLNLNVIPWMVMDGGHEHGSRPVVITKISNSDYLVEKLYFMGGMHGDWFLKIQLLDADRKIVEEIRIKVEM